MRQRPPQSPSDPVRRDPASQKVERSSVEKDRSVRKVTLDWKDYFLEFCKTHGEPVEYKSGLLFRDGWRYAMEYSGPEYPPPSDHEELDRLVVMYWTARLRVCKTALDKVFTERRRLQLLQSQHSLPLRQVTITGKGDERKKVYSDLDTRALDDRIKWLRADIKECEEQLTLIEKYYKDRKGGNQDETQPTADVSGRAGPDYAEQNGRNTTTGA